MLPVVQKLKSRGILVVCSVGNEGPETSRSPGNYAEVLSVGACDEKNRVADFSFSQVLTYPKTRIVPDLVAPGVDIVSCFPGERFFKLSGTSMCYTYHRWPGRFVVPGEAISERAGDYGCHHGIVRACSGYVPRAAQAEESPTGRVPWRSCCRKPGEKGKPRNSHGGDRLRAAAARKSTGHFEEPTRQETSESKRSESVPTANPRDRMPQGPWYDLAPYR